MKSAVILVYGVVGSVLTICRELKRCNELETYVVCINSNYRPIFKVSRYVDHVDQLSANNADELLVQMQAWYSRYVFVEKPVLYCTDDRNCRLVNKRRTWYDENFELTFPAYPIIEAFTQKGVAEIEAEKCGLLIPRSKIVHLQEDLCEIKSVFSFPVILKPCSSDMRKGLTFGKAKILSKDEFEGYCLPMVLAGATFICQEYIPGSDEKTFFYLFFRDIQGNIIESMGIKQLQSPPGQGIMAVGKTLFNETISKISRNFLNELKYNGIGGIEYKEYNGRYYFIEMNVRVEAIIYIPEISGVSICESSYKGRVDRNSSPSIQKDGMIYVDLVPLIKARVIRHKYLRLLIDICQYTFKRNVRFNILSFKDPLPFFMNVWIVFKDKYIFHRK